MKIKQLLLLFVALLLPAVIFVFLKGFGKNEFAVTPLFLSELPELPAECGRNVATPYFLSEEDRLKFSIGSDSLTCIWFAPKNERDKLQRVRGEFEGTPLQIVQLNPENQRELMRCFLALKEPFDVALVDRNGYIRGQYDADKRDEIDRLITEVAIIFKRY